MPDLWTPSDDLLNVDPIAAGKVTHPVETYPPGGHTTDNANAVAAAVILAELAKDEDDEGESGECDDDDALDDPADDGVIDA